MFHSLLVRNLQAQMQAESSRHEKRPATTARLTATAKRTSQFLAACLLLLSSCDVSWAGALSPRGAETFLQTDAPAAYTTVAASQSAQKVSATGAIGNILIGLLVIPGTTSPGAVSITDGANSAVTVFTGGASSVTDLKPFFIPLNAVSSNGGWQITTGANVTAIAVGIWN